MTVPSVNWIIVLVFWGARFVSSDHVPFINTRPSRDSKRPRHRVCLFGLGRPERRPPNIADTGYNERLIIFDVLKECMGAIS